MSVRVCECVFVSVCVRVTDLLKYLISNMHKQQVNSGAETHRLSVSELFVSLLQQAVPSHNLITLLTKSSLNLLQTDDTT